MERTIGLASDNQSKGRRSTLILFLSTAHQPTSICPPDGKPSLMAPSPQHTHFLVQHTQFLVQNTQFLVQHTHFLVQRCKFSLTHSFISSNYNCTQSGCIGQSEVTTFILTSPAHQCIQCINAMRGSSFQLLVVHGVCCHEGSLMFI